MTKATIIAALAALALLGVGLADMYWLPDDAPPAGLYAKAGRSLR